MKKKITLISIYIVAVVITIVAAKNSFANETTYTRAQLQDMVVSTALQYLYKNTYSDYEEYSTDSGINQGNYYQAGSFSYHDLTTTPELVSKTNHYAVDCSSFTEMVYMHSLGYYMSEYMTGDILNNVTDSSEGQTATNYVKNEIESPTFYKLYEKDNEPFKFEKEKCSDNYEECTLNRAYGWKVGYMQQYAKIKITNDLAYYSRANTKLKEDPEYKINDNSIVPVYYYQNNLNQSTCTKNDENYKCYEYSEDETTQSEIIENIKSTLQPGDILSYLEQRNSNDYGVNLGGHTLIYVGTAYDSETPGFIHSTGVDVEFDENGKILESNSSAGIDWYSVRFISVDDLLNYNVFHKSETSTTSYKTHSISIMRPINKFCTEDSCIINPEDIEYQQYKDNYEEYLGNTLARSELKNLEVEQYATNSTGKELSKYNSVSSNDTITYNLDLKNISTIGYCRIPDSTKGYKNSSVRGKNSCISYVGEENWKTAERSNEEYKLNITAVIPAGTELVMDENSTYTVSENRIIFDEYTIKSDEEKTFSFSVKIKDKIDKVMNPGFEITTETENKLNMPDLNIEINSTLGSEEIEKITEYISANMSTDSLTFIQNIYNNLDIDLTYLNYNDIKNTIFNNDTGVDSTQPYDVYSRKINSEISIDESTTEYKINKMLVPGLYGGRKVKGNIAGDRIPYLYYSDLQFGDLIITYSNNNAQTYMYYGDSQYKKFKAITIENGEEKIYENLNGDYDYGPNVKTKEFPGSDLFVVLRPTRLYEIENTASPETSEDEIIVDSEQMLLTPPEKEGYLFSGWYTNKDDENSYIGRTKKTYNLTVGTKLYVKWIPNTDIESKLTFNSATKSENMLLKIPINTKINSIVNTNLGTIEPFDSTIKAYKGTELLSNSALAATGEKIKITINGNTFNYGLSVIGDTDGDGNISYTDYVKVYNHIQKEKHPNLSKKLLVEEYLKAGDMNDDNQINYLDYVKIYNRIKELKKGGK